MNLQTLQAQKIQNGSNFKTLTNNQQIISNLLQNNLHTSKDKENTFENHSVVTEKENAKWKVKNGNEEKYVAQKCLHNVSKRKLSGGKENAFKIPKVIPRKILRSLFVYSYNNDLRHKLINNLRNESNFKTFSNEQGNTRNLLEGDLFLSSEDETTIEVTEAKKSVDRKVKSKTNGIQEDKKPAGQTDASDENRSVAGKNHERSSDASHDLFGNNDLRQKSINKLRNESNFKTLTGEQRNKPNLLEDDLYLSCDDEITIAVAEEKKIADRKPKNKTNGIREDKKRVTDVSDGHRSVADKNHERSSEGSYDSHGNNDLPHKSMNKLRNESNFKTLTDEQRNKPNLLEDDLYISSDDETTIAVAEEKKIADRKPKNKTNGIREDKKRVTDVSDGHRSVADKNHKRSSEGSYDSHDNNDLRHKSINKLRNESTLTNEQRNKPNLLEDDLYISSDDETTIEVAEEKKIADRKPKNKTNGIREDKKRVTDVSDGHRSVADKNHERSSEGSCDSHGNNDLPHKSMNKLRNESNFKTLTDEQRNKPNLLEDDLYLSNDNETTTENHAVVKETKSAKRIVLIIKRVVHRNEWVCTARKSKLTNDKNDKKRKDVPSKTLKSNFDFSDSENNNDLRQKSRNKLRNQSNIKTLTSEQRNLLEHDLYLRSDYETTTENHGLVEETKSNKRKENNKKRVVHWNDSVCNVRKRKLTNDKNDDKKRKDVPSKKLKSNFDFSDSENNNDLRQNSRNKLRNESNVKTLTSEQRNILEQDLYLSSDDETTTENHGLVEETKSAKRKQLNKKRMVHRNDSFCNVCKRKSTNEKNKIKKRKVILSKTLKSSFDFSDSKNNIDFRQKSRNKPRSESNVKTSINKQKNIPYLYVSNHQSTAEIHAEIKRTKLQTSTRPCERSRCKTCAIVNQSDSFRSPVTNLSYSTADATCTSSNLVYILSCTQCVTFYTGQTKNALSTRMNGHRASTKKLNQSNSISVHTHSHQIPFDLCWTVCVIELLPPDTTSSDRRDWELSYQCTLKSIQPPGLNRMRAKRYNIMPIMALGQEQLSTVL